MYLVDPRISSDPHELIRFWARSAQGQRSKVGCRTNGL